LDIKTDNGFPEIDVKTAHENKNLFRLIDVRNPDEFVGELGHIEGAELITLGPNLQNFLESADKAQSILFVCRSGGRSGQATHVSRQMGFQKTINMTGGMLEWSRLRFPVVFK
jgi:rhodanese-related sulfurtransferase